VEAMIHSSVSSFTHYLCIGLLDETTFTSEMHVFSFLLVDFSFHFVLQNQMISSFVSQNHFLFCNLMDSFSSKWCQFRH
jgi:hypothetical protein